MDEQKILYIEDIRHEINYKTNGMNQEIYRINKKFTDDICELNKKYDYWLNNKNLLEFINLVKKYKSPIYTPKNHH